jgi:hypothetical protein
MALAVPNPNGVWSFVDLQVTLIYPNGTTVLQSVTGTQVGGVDVGAGGFSEEGLRITRLREKNIMTEGADGSIMHSLRASKAARIMLSFLKTAPANAALSQVWNAQEGDSSQWGRNSFHITQTSTGDNFTLNSVAFVKFPDTNYRAEGGVMDWEFDVGFCDSILGNGYNPTNILNPAVQ